MLIKNSILIFQKKKKGRTVEVLIETGLKSLQSTSVASTTVKYSNFSIHYIVTSSIISRSIKWFAIEWFEEGDRKEFKAQPSFHGLWDPGVEEKDVSNN